MGIQIAKKEQKLGIRASSTCSLAFDDLRVPAENVLGGEGKGYKIAIEILNEGRIGIAAQMLGLAQGAFDRAVPYTFQRAQFGKPVGTFQGMAFQQAEAAVQLEAARVLTYNAARRKEEGREFVREAAIAKYAASQVAQKVAGAAIEWAGGVGFTRETGIEKYWRDSKIVSDCRCARTLRELLLTCCRTGRHLRGHVEYSTTDHRQVHPKAVLISSLLRPASILRSLGTHCTSYTYTIRREVQAHC